MQGYSAVACIATAKDGGIVTSEASLKETLFYRPWSCCCFHLCGVDMAHTVCRAKRLCSQSALMILQLARLRLLQCRLGSISVWAKF